MCNLYLLKIKRWVAIFLFGFIASCATPQTESELTKLLDAAREQGIRYEHLGQLDLALERYNEGVLLSELKADDLVAAEFYRRLGGLYVKLKDNHTAAKMYQASIQRLESMEQSVSWDALIAARLGLAKTKTTLGLLDESLADYVQLSSDINKLNSQRNRDKLTITIRNGKGIIERKKGNFAQAAYWLERAYQIGVEIDDRESIASSAYNLAILKMKTEDYEKALEYADIALRMDKARESVMDIHSDLKLLQKIYQQRGNLQEVNSLDVRIRTIEKRLFRIGESNLPATD